VAKRATSPKALKLKTSTSNAGSRATSPLAGSRATSPVASGSRAASPVAQSSGAQRPVNKRKAEDGTAAAPSPGGAGGADGAGGPPKAKKRRAVGELNEQLVVDWLKATPTPKIRDCIQYFTPYLGDKDIKKRFTDIVKEVARVRDGFMVLRPRYAGGSAAASPAAVEAN
jgi:transcription initiation factor TFIIF subunit alpha